MKVINSGSTFELYGDDLKTFDKLPAYTYTIKFSKMVGFYLERTSDIEVGEPKVYGIHKKKVEKVLSTFSKVCRNLGVILSGDKGIGKSLFVRLLAEEGKKKDLPVIIVEKYIPDIAAYISKIDQEAIFIFDEFDKTFYNEISKELELSKQDSHKFKKVVNQFLKNNNYDSLEEFCLSCDTDEKFCSFIENVAEELNLSDEKADILENEFVKNLAVNKLSKAFEEDDSLLETFLPFAIESMKNNLVSDNLIKAFDLDEKEQQNINSYLQKLESDISPEQIAYEITDGYNLSSLEDYNYVLKTIKSRDKLFKDFISEDDSEND